MKRSVFVTAVLTVLLFSFCTPMIINAQGGGWIIVPNPTTGGSGVVSIFMLDANDGWALCEYSGSEFPRSEIIQWNGETWNLVENPIEVYPMSDLHMVSANDGWAVGGWGGIIRWDGVKWTNFTGPTKSWMRSLDMISPNDGWAVGHIGVTIHWDGNNWSEVASPTTNNLLGVNMVSANDVWAVGEGGTIMHWDGENWNIAALSPNRETLNDVFMLSATEGWIVGGNWGTSDSGSILRWDGENWSQIEIPTSIALFSVYAISANDAWAVGGNWNIPNGIIMHWDGIKWSIVTSPSGIALRSVFILDTGDGWAGGTDGTTIRWTGKMPVAFFSSSPSSPSIEDSITFDGSGSEDVDGTVIGYDWDFGDGSTGTGITASHSYSLESTYTVTLTVTDNDGLVDTIQKTITITQPAPTPTEPEPTTPAPTPTEPTPTEPAPTEPEPTPTETEPIGADQESPVAFAGSDMTAKVGLVVSFSGAGSSDNVGIVSYEWDFGDGTTGTGVTTSHTYSAEGTYTVTLRVEDAAGNSDAATFVVTVGAEGEAGFPFWILIPIIGAIVAVVVVWFFLKKRKPKKKAPKPVKVRITAEPSELLADGKTKSAITVELLDKEGNPVPAPDNTEIKLTTTKGMIEQPIVKISKGNDSEKTLLVSPKEGGKATLSADVDNLGSTSVTVTFMEKTRYCMHCGSKTPFAAKNCPVCGRSPPAGVDTQSCKKCNAVIPSVANFCAECGARQPSRK